MENRHSNNLKPHDSNTSLNHKEKLERYRIDQKSAKFTIMLCIFIDVLGYSMILPLLPTIVIGSFGGSNFMIGLLIASNALTAFIFAPIWGKLSDKYGRKPFLIISQMGTLAAFLMLGFSNSLAIIFLSRLLDGIFGGQIPIIRAYVIDITDSKTRSSEIGKITAASAFGIIFGPAIGGLLGVFNWRYPVYIACFLSLLTIIFTFKYIIESMPKQRILDLRKQKELSKMQNHGKKDSVLTKIVIFRLIEVFLIIFAFIMITSTFPLIMTLRYGSNVAMIGLLASIAGIIMMITGGILMKPLIKKFGEKAMLILSLIMAISMFLIYPFLYEEWFLYLFILPYIFSHIFIRSIILTNLSKSVEEDQQGAASGFASNMMSIAQIFAPLIAYWYLELWIVSIMGYNVDAYFLIGITCVFITIILLILVIIDMKKYPEIFSSWK